MTLNNLADYKVILLLASYDESTKKVVYESKERLIENFSFHDTNIFVFLLDSLHIYVANVLDDYNRKQRIALIIEKYVKNKITIIRVLNETIIDIADVETNEDLDTTVNIFLKERYSEANFHKLTLLEQLKHLSRLASLTFLIRDQELSRGGEYIEMVYLLSGHIKPDMMYFMKREGFQLSAMALEILDYFKVHFRSYLREVDLHREMTRIVYNNMR